MASPKDFFVGLIDFFAVILPGAVLAYFLRDGVGRHFIHRPLNETGGWVVFLFASYLLGHFIFLLGSWLDELYDSLRRRTLNHQIRRLARTGVLLPRWQRVLLRLIFKREQDLAVDRAAKIKAHYLTPLDARAAVNTFQWSKARLALEQPEALATVQRFEADSKFFRSLVVVLLLLPFVSGAERFWMLAITAVLLTPLALWRYMEQRHKATNQAYWFIITMEAAKGTIQIAANRSAGPTHAGGVVFRRAPGRIEYLLVQAAARPDEWVLPKGHIEIGETARETAVREVLEETGVWARITDALGEMAYEDERGKPVVTQVFLMEFLEQTAPLDQLREVVWLPLPEAVDRATFPTSRDLLLQADRRFNAPPAATV